MKLSTHSQLVRERKLNRLTRNSEPRRTHPFPAIDISEDKDGLTVLAELPGLSPDDVEVSIEGEVLTIAGDKKNPHSPLDDLHIYSERSFGRFERSYRLPDRIDPNAVSAEYSHGILEVRLSVKNSARTRDIPITNS